MGLTLPGLASNLDTAAIIKALMDVQAIPKTLLEGKKADKQLIIAQLQSLNSNVQAIGTSAGNLTTPESLAQQVARSSSDAVSVTAGTAAAPVSASIVVDQIATRHAVVTAAQTAWTDDPPVLTLKTSAGELIEITAESTSLQDVARALNSADAGVTATVVSAGKDGAGAPLFRLQITSTETGADGSFILYRGDAAAVTANTAVDVAAEAGAAVVNTGQDAQVRLWAGTDAEQVLTSASNTFAELFPGVDVTVATAGAAPVTITVAPDLQARTRAVSTFVTQIASTLANIARGSTATPPTSAGGTTTLGVFTGDATVRALRRALEDAVQFPVDGVSPSTIGISFDKNGVLSFDSAAFTAAMEADPAAVTALVNGVAARVEQTATSFSDKYDGMLTARITGQEDEVGALGEQIERWELRLEQRKATLQRTYAAMETMLSRMQSQSDYLTSQLNALNPKGSGS